MSRVVVAAAVLLAVLVSGTDAQTVTWKIAPDLRIGDLHRPDYTLTRISDVAIGDDGSIFVGQPDERVIRVYDRNGQFARNIGREGGGPGEFRSVDTLIITQRGLLALDKSQRRLTLFTLTGRPVTSWGIPSHQYGDNLWGTAPRTVLADGSLAVLPASRTRPGEESRVLPLLQFDSTVAFQRTLAWLKHGGSSVRVQVDRLVSYMRQPVNSETLWSTTHDRSEIVLVDRTFPTSRTPGTFKVVRVNVDGDTIGNRAEHGRLTLGAAGSIHGRGGDMVGSWSKWRDPSPYHHSSRVHVLRVSSDHLWGIERGEFDEQYVVRFRITR